MLFFLYTNEEIMQVNKQENKEHKHHGHRQRLKDKVRKNGLSSLSEHEIIELLLTYTIPRRDTNALAHDMLDSYSSISGLIDANYKDLQKINGVGEETALFFKVVSQLFDIYKSKSNVKSVKIDSVYAGVNYFRSHYSVRKVEKLVVLCISKIGRVVSAFEVDGENDSSVSFDMKFITDNINRENTSSIVLYHTHPNGDVNPSKEDMEITQRIFNICAVMGIMCLDHIIFNEDKHFSFRDNHLIEIMEKNCNILFPYIDFKELENKNNFYKV